MHISFNHQFPFILCRLVHNEQYMNREKRYALQYHQQWQLSVSYCTVYNVKTCAAFSKASARERSPTKQYL